VVAPGYTLVDALVTGSGGAWFAPMRAGTNPDAWAATRPGAGCCCARTRERLPFGGARGGRCPLRCGTPTSAAWPLLRARPTWAAAAYAGVC